MNILSLITSHWNTLEEFAFKASGPFGLDNWLKESNRLFSPIVNIIACGTWSDPGVARKHWGTEMGIQIINSGTEYYGPYDVIWSHYALAAHMAGFYHALNRNDWDLLVQIDNDMLIGDVDFDSLLREFLSRPEEVLSPAWCGCWPGGPFWAWKREGLSRFVNWRTRANFIDPDSRVQYQRKLERPHLSEEEMFHVMKGRWWNPWPNIPSCRQDFGQNPDANLLNETVMSWPFVRLPHPDVIGRYMREQSAKTKPVISGEGASR